MPAVFVHGVPDTPRVWNAIRERLPRRDVIALSLPGFGCPLPAGFDPTKESYVDWLLGELSAIDGPIDLVGHDWGGLLVIRSVSLRPDIVRTWAAGASPLDPEYVWHDTAQLWQTPELGEQMMAAATPEAMAAGLQGAGIPEAEAVEVSRHFDDTMKKCILRLYRSATKASEEWYPDLARVKAPGLVIWGDRDPFVAPHFADRLGANTGAEVLHLDCGHWWPLERPDDVAAALARSWSRA